MNSYEVEFRKPGFGSNLDRYTVLAGSLEDAIARARLEIPNDFGRDYRYEFVSVRETAREVLLPKTKAATGKR